MNNAATTSATVTTLNPIPNATAQRSTALPVIDNFRFVNLYLSHRLFFGANRHSPDKRSRQLEKSTGRGEISGTGGNISELCRSLEERPGTCVDGLSVSPKGAGAVFSSRPHFMSMPLCGSSDFMPSIIAMFLQQPHMPMPDCFCDC